MSALFWRENSSHNMLEMASKSSVRVAVSVRPLNEKERENGEERVVWTRNDEVRVLNPESRKEKVFKFDHTVSY